MNIAVIFAGGTGTRMNTRSVPKQFLELHGKPVLVYTLEQFDAHPDIDAIVLVCLSSWIDYAKKLLAQYRLSKVQAVVPGGSSGQESIFHGLTAAMGLSKMGTDALKPSHRHLDNVIPKQESRSHPKHDAEEQHGTGKDIVLIHDGVRPLIDAETIHACIESVKTYGNAVTTTPAIETIFVNDEQEQVGHIFNRSRCAMARAPQCFYLQDIYGVHLRAQAEGKNDFIDSAMLMQHYGAKLHTVEGPVENIKITTPMDFYLFRALLDAKENMQIVGL